MFGRRLNQSRYINPLTGFGFKRLFDSEQNKAILIDFLNVILPEHHTVSNLHYRNDDNTACNAIFDIYCKSKSGERFIVEIQRASHNFFRERSVYYESFPIQEQARKKIWDREISSVYTVGVLDFVFNDHKNDDTILHTVELQEEKCEALYDRLRFIYLELPKFTKTVEQLETHFDKWLFLLKHLPDLDAPPQVLQEGTFRQLFEVAEIANFSPNEQDAYENSLKYYRDLKNVVDTSREEGWEEGREKGREEGIEEGREDATVRLVIRLLEKRFGSLTEVIQSTIGALSLDVLEALSEDLLDFSDLDNLETWLKEHAD